MANGFGSATLGASFAGLRLFRVRGEGRTWVGPDSDRFGHDSSVVSSGAHSAQQRLIFAYSGRSRSYRKRLLEVPHSAVRG
jgi:hypothetical protein